MEVFTIEYRLIIKPSIAKKLLNAGYRIIDLKPQKQIDGSVDYSRCVFLFAAEGLIDEEIKKLTNK